jgi:hypothetical protein
MTTLSHRRGKLTSPGICTKPPTPPLPPGTPVIDCWIRPRVNPRFPGQTTAVDIYCSRKDWTGNPTVTLTHTGLPPAYTAPLGMTDGQLIEGVFHAQSGTGFYLLTTTFRYVDGITRSASALMSVDPPM